MLHRGAPAGHGHPLPHSQYPEEYDRILTDWRGGTETLATLERNTFDWDHAEVAELIGVDADRVAGGLGRIEKAECLL